MVYTDILPRDLILTFQSCRVINLVFSTLSSPRVTFTLPQIISDYDINENNSLKLHGNSLKILLNIRSRVIYCLILFILFYLTESIISDICHWFYLSNLSVSSLFWEICMHLLVCSSVIHILV